MARIFLSIAFAVFSSCAHTQDKSNEKFHCEEITHRDFLDRSSNWRGKTLVAFASWCSSCRSNITEARKNPDHFVLIAAFDEKSAAEKVIAKWSIKSPCFFGEDLVSGLGIPSLPWVKKL